MGSGAPLRRDRAKQSEPSSITGPQKLKTMLHVTFPAGPIFADLKLLSLFDQAVFRVFVSDDPICFLETERKGTQNVQREKANKVRVSLD